MRALGILTVLASLLSALAGCTHTVYGSGDSDAPASTTATPRVSNPPSYPSYPPSSATPPASSNEGAVSSLYEVGQIMASMSATSDGNEVRVVAALLADGVGGDSIVNGTHLRLDGDDRLTARLGAIADQTPMTRVSGTDGAPRYEARIPVTPGVSQQVIVAFFRAPGRPDARLSAVWLAGDFGITSAPQSLRPGTPAKVSVTNGAATKVDVVGDCIEGPGGRVTVGTFTGGTDLAIDTNKIFFKAGTTSCSALLDVRRETTGKVDSAFKRGLFGAAYAMEGLQDRAVTVYVSK